MKQWDYGVRAFYNPGAKYYNYKEPGRLPHLAFETRHIGKRSMEMEIGVAKNRDDLGVIEVCDINIYGTPIKWEKCG